MRKKAADRHVVHVFPAQLRAKVFGKAREFIAISPHRVRRGVPLPAQRLQKFLNPALDCRIHRALSLFHLYSPLNLVIPTGVSERAFASARESPGGTLCLS